MSDKYEVLNHGGGGSETILICGAVRIDHPAAQDLVRLLPKLIHIKAWNSPHADWMHSTLRLIAAEAQAQMPGGETIVTGLSDILVVQAIRAWLLDHPEERTGWLGALDDERIGPVLVQIQQDPSQPWTVESLAVAASMSRSAFAARFNELVGESPMHFVTRWRMHTAGTWLRDDGLTIAECGSRLGYNFRGRVQPSL